MTRRKLPLAKMLTVAQVAEILQVPPDTIYYWRTVGEGPRGHRYGKHLRFHEADVQAWLASKADTP
jgi:excisionase family DNA binding protein